MSDWLIEPRNLAGVRAEDPISLWDRLNVVTRLNKPGPFTLAGPAAQLAPLMAPGMGVVLSRNGLYVSSGQVTAYTTTGDGNAQVTGWDDKLWLGGAPADDRGVVITPNAALPITGQTAQSVTRTGTRESLILGWISDHCGPTALAARRVPRLRVPASLSRGGTTAYTAKLDLLHVVYAALAEAGGLVVNVVHTEEGSARYLDVVITPQEDVSATVRFGPATEGGAGVLGDDWSYTVAGPSMTTAIVGGTAPPPQVFGDENPDPVDLRQYRQVAAAVGDWGMRIEGFVDASSTNTAAELDQAGLDALNEAVAKRDIQASIVDTPDVGYGVDWRVGSRVGVTVAGVEGSDVVREVSTTVQAQQGQQTESVTAAIGWSQASVVTTTTQQQTLMNMRRAYKIAVWG